MAFEEFDTVLKRIAFTSAKVEGLSIFAGGRYWRMAGIFTSLEIPDIIKEMIYKPAGKEIIIDCILDKISPASFSLIRVSYNASRETLDTAQVIYNEMMAELPVYHLSEIINKANDLSSLSEQELHALGKGYDPDLRTEIQQILRQLAEHPEITISQKQAAIIAIGYISDPLHFNSVLEVFMQDASSEVAELAQDMFEAGQAVLRQ